MSRILLAIVFALTVSATHPFAWSQQFDQVAIPGSSNLNMGSANLVWQQEITAGVTGTLAGIDVWFHGSDGEVDISIFRGGGWQTGTPQFSKHFVTPAINGWQFLDLSDANFSLSTNERYVIEFRAVELPGTLNARGSSSPGLYGGGMLFLNGSSSTDRDLAFRTYMTTARNADVVIDIIGEPGSSTITVSFSGGIRVDPISFGGQNSYNFSAPSGTFYQGPFSQVPVSNFMVTNTTAGSPQSVPNLIDFNNGPSTDSIRFLDLNPRMSGSRHDVIEFQGSETIQLSNGATFDDFLHGRFRINDVLSYSGSVIVNVLSSVQELTPTSFLVTRGTYQSGGLNELAASDNSDLSITRSTSDIQSRTELEIETVSPFQDPTSLQFTLEGSVFARTPVNQTIELFDYDLGAWESVDTRQARRFQDLEVTLDLTGDLSRFIESGTSFIRARVRFQSVGQRQSFTSNIDRIGWTIER